MINFCYWFFSFPLY